MISRIGSPGYTESSSRVQKTREEPAAARSRSAPPAAQSAAVVRISNDARARASQAGAEQTRAFARSEARAEISIEPVVAQPVPDFKAPEAALAEPADDSPKEAYRAPTKDAPLVA